MFVDTSDVENWFIVNDLNSAIPLGETSGTIDYPASIGDSTINRHWNDTVKCTCTETQGQDNATNRYR